MSAVSTRRTLFAGATAVVVGGGITAGAAASIADLVGPKPHLDAALLSLHAALLAAVADVSLTEMVATIPDERVTEVSDRLVEVCWEIIDAPLAQTAAGRALKAAGAMYQLRNRFTYGEWRSDGEELAWHVLSELAGEVYVPPVIPERIRANCEPGRA